MADKAIPVIELKGKDGSSFGVTVDDIAHLISCADARAPMGGNKTSFDGISHPTSGGNSYNFHMEHGRKVSLVTEDGGRNFTVFDNNPETYPGREQDNSPNSFKITADELAGAVGNTKLLSSGEVLFHINRLVQPPLHMVMREGQNQAVLSYAGSEGKAMFDAAREAAQKIAAHRLNCSTSEVPALEVARVLEEGMTGIASDRRRQ